MLDFGLSRWIWEQVLCIIDWLNSRTGTTGKPKQKHTTEQMATLSELFEGYEEFPPAPGLPTRDTNRR
jgi:hypothetical protein